MRVAVNWLPSSPAASMAVAEAAEGAGFWGLGVTDSPRADELYGTVSLCRSVTRRLAVGPCVTNPVTRHDSVHVAAARQAAACGLDRAFLGLGTGDSAVRALGLRPARAARVVECATKVRAAVGDDLRVVVAAAGPRAAAAAGACGGLLAGSGRDLDALGEIGAVADAAAAGHPVERWLSLRAAVAADAAERDELRRAMLPRALSATRFNLHRLSGVPDEWLAVLHDRFRAYDFAHHGRSGDHSNADLLADRPDIEAWALDRFAVIGLADEVAADIAALGAAGVDGVFLSVRFENAVGQIRRLGAALRAAGVLDAPLLTATAAPRTESS